MAYSTNRPVVVGVDGSESARQAVRWAAREAARRRGLLVLLHVWTPVSVAAPYPGTMGRYEEVSVEQGRSWLADAVTTAQEAVPGITTTTKLTSGPVAGQLVGWSVSADLVVLGSRGLGGFQGLLVGSTAVAVVTHGHCPVVVVRGADPQSPIPQDGPVVLGVDESRVGEAAIPFAFEAAFSRKVPLRAVHTWSDVPVTTTWELTTGWQAIQEAESQVLGQWLAEQKGRYPSVRVEQVVVRDRPTHVLLEEAENAQLVVVGSRGRGGFRGLLLGSVSQAMIQHAACPVAVVPSHRR